MVTQFQLFTTLWRKIHYSFLHFLYRLIWSPPDGVCCVTNLQCLTRQRRGLCMVQYRLIYRTIHPSFTVLLSQLNSSDQPPFHFRVPSSWFINRSHSFQKCLSRFQLPIDGLPYISLRAVSMHDLSTPFWRDDSLEQKHHPHESTENVKERLPNQYQPGLAVDVIVFRRTSILGLALFPPKSSCRTICSIHSLYILEGFSELVIQSRLYSSDAAWL